MTGVQTCALPIFFSPSTAAVYNGGLKYYTITVPTNTGTGYTITATKQSSFTDPKCGNFTMAVANGVSTYDVTSGDKDYCWRKK